jgi:hypothetical protein
MKCFNDFLKEDFFPGTVEVPGDAYITQVNSRNYQAAHQPMPEVYDAMFESAYFCDFLDECGKSESFNKFLGENKKSASDITNHIKDSFLEKSSKGKNK